MTTDLPAPLLPATVDLRAFRRMPLDVVRLRDSEIAVRTKGDEFRCAVLLWCASWHQVPAGSLPDDDLILADLAGFGRVVREWKRIRPGALRGFVKCSDGRLYHPVVVEMAIEGWRARLDQRWKTECARLKKQAQRTRQDIVLPEFNLWITHECPEFTPYLSKGTRPIVPEDIPQPSPGQPPLVPRETASKGREGKGSNYSSSLALTTGASTGQGQPRERESRSTPGDMVSAGQAARSALPPHQQAIIDRATKGPKAA